MSARSRPPRVSGTSRLSRPRRQVHPRGGWAIVAALAALGCIAGAELLARGYAVVRESPTSGPPPLWRLLCQPGDHPDLPSVLRPHLIVSSGGESPVQYRVVRGVRVVGSRDLSRPRILVVGDDVTFGVGIAAEATFVSRAEARLRRWLPRACLINGGVPGYSTRDELAWLEIHGIRFAPDMVVLTVSVEDMAAAEAPLTHTRLTAQGVTACPTPAGERPPALHRFLRERLHSLSLIEGRAGVLAAVRRAGRHRCGEDPLLQFLPFGDCLLDLCAQQSQYRPLFASNLAALASFSRIQHLQWAVLYLPLAYERAQGAGACARNVIADMVADYGARVIDPLEHPPPAMRGLYQNVHSLSDAGHGWVGEALTEELLPMLLP